VRERITRKQAVIDGYYRAAQAVVAADAKVVAAEAERDKAVRRRDEILAAVTVTLGGPGQAAQVLGVDARQARAASRLLDPDRARELARKLSVLTSPSASGSRVGVGEGPDGPSVGECAGPGEDGAA
jgi:hypothetical protein